MDYEIYCDMDGVLADFEKGFEDKFGMTPKEWTKIHNGDFDGTAWPAIEDEGHFFYNLPLMPEAQKLWNYIKIYKPIILTSDAKTVTNCRTDKIKWMREKLNTNCEIIFAHDKSKYAKPNRILIDDYHRKLDPWKQRGGIGILFKNTKKTIKELQKLGL